MAIELTPLTEEAQKGRQADDSLGLDARHLPFFGIRVLDLGFRWGSCSPGGALNFHWATLLLPSSVVDYVVVHELVHLHESHHTPEFWRRVERAMPDYERRQKWLAKHGGSYLTTEDHRRYRGR
jgi:hypothetical protein